MKKQLLMLSLMIIVLYGSGCASIICGSEKTINISSGPVGAKYAIENRKGNVIAQGVTPENVTLKRGSGWFKAGDYKITLEKAGYKKRVQPISQGIEVGWYGFGNIVFGGLIGWVIVDPLTGAMYNIEDVNISLEPEQGAILLPNNYGPRIALTDKKLQSLQSRMVRIN